MRTLSTFNRFGDKIGSITFQQADVIGYIHYVKTPTLIRLSVRGMTDVWVDLKEYEGVSNEQEEESSEAL